MYNLIHFYQLWQPTFIYFPNFEGNSGQSNSCPVDYKITEGETNSVCNQNGQIMRQNSAVMKVELEQAPPIIWNSESRDELSKNQLKPQVSREEDRVKCGQKGGERRTSRRRKSSSKLLFDVEWKNQNRNIVPNIMNQMFSFLQKRNRSEQLIEKLFLKYNHAEQCCLTNYYSYMKRMKSSMGHYISQNELQSIRRIQEPQFSIYSKQEQLFYLKISRIAMIYFFMTDSVLVTLTSNRMSHQKRNAHLIARRALLQRVHQLFRQAQY